MAYDFTSSPEVHDNTEVNVNLTQGKIKFITCHFLWLLGLITTVAALIIAAGKWL